MERFLRTADRRYFTNIKSISFLAPIETNDQFRCIHYKLSQEPVEVEDDLEGWEPELAEKINDMGELMHQIRPLLVGLPDNQLKSFQYVKCMKMGAPPIPNL